MARIAKVKPLTAAEKEALLRAYWYEAAKLSLEE
jgi:hypothetical protein